DKRPLREKILPTAMAFAVGIAFFWMIWLGVSGLPEGAATVPAEGNDLLSIGKALTEEHMLSLEVLALTLFLVLIGAGVIARPEASDR
ncbi:MAG: NADH-quinone oxidoreductase subunit J, partial [Bdellovibrionota bacterium]